MEEKVVIWNDQSEDYGFDPVDDDEEELKSLSEPITRGEMLDLFDELQTDILLAGLTIIVYILVFST